MPIIQVENLIKSFGSINAVDNISFEVDSGIIFGFLGPNGAGKTTTINILCTLLSATSGTAFIDGSDCIKSPDAVRKKIGIVFQDNTLDKELTAYENLMFHARLYGVQGSLRKERVESALHYLGLMDRRNDTVKKFSGGMKRRLEVARAIVHQPKVLFLDEPTLGLDPQSRISLWEFISTLPAAQGVTVFMTTHYMEEAEICSRIAVIDSGKIIASGSPEELKKLVGGDMIYLKTKDNQRAAALLKEQMNIDSGEQDGELFIEAARADACIPKIINILADDALSVRMQRPTLNDVFLKLTGKTIRQEQASGRSDLKDSLRSHNRKFDR